jgi:hypothetical protein
VIQASHVSTGTTNNALALNPSGGNVGVGTTAPLTSFHILNSTADATSQLDNAPTSHILLRNTKAGASPYSMGLGVDQTTGAGYINAAGNGAIQPVCLQTRGGNVGIGTTTPTQMLDITNAASFTPAIRIQNTYSAGYLSMGINAGVNSYIGLQATNTTTSSLTTPAFVVTNTGSGNVGIGTTTPTFPLTFIGSAACFGWNTTGTTYSDPIYTAVEGISLRTYGGAYGIFSASASIPLFLGKYGTGIIASFKQSAAVGTSGIDVGNISVTASATTYNSGSDRRLKENIQDVADIRGMINHLRPRTFQFIRDDQKETYIGFIAQEIRENYPQYISGQETETEYLSMDYGKFSPFAISACKDLYNENDALKVRIAALEAEVAAKSASLDALIAWAQTMGYSASS